MKKNTRPSSIRDDFWYQAMLPILSKISINTQPSILSIGLNDNDFKKKLLTLFPNANISTIGINNFMVNSFEENLAVYKKSHYDFIFVFDFSRGNNYEELSFLTYTYDLLKPMAPALLVFHTKNTPTRKTYQRILESGRYPQLGNDRLEKYDAFVEKVISTLPTLPFSHHEIETFHSSFEMPDLASYKEYMSSIDFLYKPIMSSEKSLEIIEQQLKYFEEMCQKEYNGRYLFEYEAISIVLRK